MDQTEVVRIALEGWRVPRERLRRMVRLDLCPDCAEAFEALCDAAEKVARPRAAWRREEVQSAGTDAVLLGGEVFQSAMLARNLSAAGRAYPYLASCGPELDSLASGPEDPFAGYWLDCLKALALDSVFDDLRASVLADGPALKLNSMNPGSGNATLWPLDQQSALFRLLGPEIQAWTSVACDESFLMHPNKSVSGVFFFGVEDFESCAYCDRADCPDRRAPAAATERRI